MYASSPMEHGTINYDYATGTAIYSHPKADDNAPIITLLIGKNDTVESWMKVGNANAMADILIAQNKCTPCKIIVTNQTNGGISINADDYSSWQERIAALEKVLISMN